MIDRGIQRQGRGGRGGRAAQRLAALVQLAVLWLVGMPAVWAAPGDVAAPPGRVGQLAQVVGTARMRLEPGAPWEDAVPNMPVAAGMAWLAEKASRIDLRIGSASVRVTAGAQCQLAELDDSNWHLELSRGVVILRVQTLGTGEHVSVGAGGARLQLLAAGTYRVGFTPGNGRLSMLVLEGAARLGAARQEHALGARQLTVADTRSGALVSQEASEDRIALDDFAQSRERRAERSVALRLLNPEMTGADALDGHGAWRSDANIGAVWFPDKLPPDWAPYRFGHWRWLAAWGWTWIDDAVWGFAPTHYGRWLFMGGRWGWVPGSPGGGALAAKPVFAPALVGFYGGAGHGPWSPIANGPAVVGWYPLAPGETYWPAYTSQLAYARALNVASVADAAALQAWPEAQSGGPAHRYARTAFAATAVAQAMFQGMAPVAANQLQITPAILALAPLSARRSAPALAPLAAVPAR